MTRHDCDHVPFYRLRDELEKKGERFTRGMMDRLCYGSLMLSVIGNAGKAAGSWEDYEASKNARMERFKGLCARELAEQTYCDGHEEHEAFQRLADGRGPLEDHEADPEIQLYRNMLRLRGNWFGGRNSPFLARIYRLIDECLKRENLPIGWLAAVKKNADTFDGHFNDGRIMRDGQLVLPEEVAKTLGFPSTAASGNLAKMMGARPPKAGGYRGSYEELWDQILTPEQRVEYMRPYREDE